MPSVGEWFEREAGGFDPLANAAMTENVDLDAAGPKRPRDRQLRRNVAAAVHDGEQNLHRAFPSHMQCGIGQDGLGHQQHPVMDVVDRQPAVEPQELPGVDVGGDDEDVDQPGALGGRSGSRSAKTSSTHSRWASRPALFIRAARGSFSSASMASAMSPRRS